MKTINNVLRKIIDFFDATPRLMSRRATEEYKKDPEKFMEKIREAKKSTKLRD